MKKIANKIVIIMLAFAIAFTCIPYAAGTVEAQAASKPGMVKTLTLRAGATYVNVIWTRAAKPVSGYAIYKNGKELTRVGASKTSYKDTAVKPATSYTYQVRPFKTEQKKQYFNTTTKKWQDKQPASKDWKTGKTRTVTSRVYGKASPKITIKTTTKKKVVAKRTTSPYLSIRVKTKSNSAVISGTGYKGATTYKLYKNGKFIKNLKANSNNEYSYTDNDLKWNSKYTYRVEAYEGNTKTVQVQGTATTPVDPKGTTSSIKTTVTTSAKKAVSKTNPN